MITNFLNNTKIVGSRIGVLLIAISTLFMNTTSLVLAATPKANDVLSAPNPVSDPALTGDGIGGGLFENYIIPFTNFLAATVGLIVVISIIYGAIEYSSAGGDPNKVAKARGRISKAVVSLIVFFFLYAILQWIVPGGIGG